MSATMRPVHLLVVDDDDVDRELVMRGLRKAKIGNPVSFAVDGVEALARLRGAEGFIPVPRPYIVVLDWKMPRMGGAEFLDELRSDPKLEDSIVFVLTTSANDGDIAAAYQRSANGYVIKERAGPDFLRLIDLLDAFWKVVELPTGSAD